MRTKRHGHALAGARVERHGSGYALIYIDAHMCLDHGWVRTKTAGGKDDLLGFHANARAIGVNEHCTYDGIVSAFGD